MAAQEQLVTAKNLGEQFVMSYYNTFDTNRQSLAPLFVDVSIMNFENVQMLGGKLIMEKLINLPFQQVQHVMTTVDSQPTVDGGIMIHVVGQLKTDNDPPHGFSESFYLKQDPASRDYKILNNVFRLNLHHG